MSIRRFAVGALVAAGTSLAASNGSALADQAPAYHVGEAAPVFNPAAERHWRGARTHALVSRLWYPVDPMVPEAPHMIGPPGHEIFEGHPIAFDGKLAAGKSFPLLMLSHGTGGGADSLDWLGAALAASGYIVVGVNHPGNNALEPLTAEGFRLWWERATDISEALDGILADPVMGPRIDRNRIGAMGFSLGGYTVLELAGARTDRAHFDAFCKSAEADAICHPPEAADMPEAVEHDWTKGATPETLASLKRSGGSFRDRRIKAVFALAPALGEAFDEKGFATVKIPVAIMAGAEDVTVPVATNVQRMARFLPAAEVTMVPGAGHYTFIGVCAPAPEAKGVPFCQDGAGVDRAAVHDQAIAAARSFFARNLAGGS